MYLKLSSQGRAPTGKFTFHLKPISLKWIPQANRSGLFEIKLLQWVRNFDWRPGIYNTVIELSWHVSNLMNRCAGWTPHGWHLCRQDARRSHAPRCRRRLRAPAPRRAASRRPLEGGRPVVTPRSPSRREETAHRPKWAFQLALNVGSWRLSPVECYTSGQDYTVFRCSFVSCQFVA